MKTKLLFLMMVLAYTPICFSATSSIKDLQCFPSEATSNDWIKIRYQYNFTAQPCTRDSFNVTVVDKLIQINVYYNVGFALSPISGYDSLTINRLQPDTYTLVVKTIDIANHYSDSTSISLTINQGYTWDHLSSENLDLLFTLTNDKIYYNCLQAVSTLTVYDLHGFRVKSYQLNNDEGVIDLSSLKNGIYFIRIEQDGKTMNKKMIVRNRVQAR
jgi:hypothetical protein